MSKAIHFITIFILMVNANAAPTIDMKYFVLLLAVEKDCPDTRRSNDPYLIHASMVCMFKNLRLLDERGQYIEPSTRAEEILITFARNADDCARKVTPFSPLSEEFPPFDACIQVAVSGLLVGGPSDQN